MALQNFIRQVWIAGIMRALRKAHVFASLANTNYQGQLKNLYDTVQIMMIGDIEAKSYSKDTDIDSPEDVMDAATKLTADQPYYFNFKVNDVEAVQSKPTVLAEAAERASYAFRDVVDLFFAGLHAQSALQVYASGTTPYDVNSLNVEDVLLDIRQQMDEANIPPDMRFLTIPPWFETKVIQAGLTTKTSNDQLFANGVIGNVLGFDLRKSNNISEATPATHTDARLIAGIKGQSLSFAGVINNIEAYRPEKRFEDAVKGLYIFGGKVMRPDMTATVHCTYAAET